jgi:hypothetical protein
MFTVPLLILGIDGVRPHHHINENPFWTGKRLFRFWKRLRILAHV